MFNWLRRWQAARAKGRADADQAARYASLRKELAEWRKEPHTDKDERDWEELRKAFEASGNFEPEKSQ